MTTAPAAATARPGPTIACWAITAIVIGECAIGGAMDLPRMAPVFAVVALGSWALRPPTRRL